MCFPQYSIGSRQFLPIFGEESYDALEREGARGREARVQSEESCSRGGRGTTQRGREAHSCVLVRMRKHKQVETGRDTVVFWLG